MSSQHNALSRGTLSDALKRAFGSTKSEAGLERFSETLTPSWDQWSRGEWAALRAEKLWGADVPQAAVALEFGFVAFGNNTTTQLLVVDGISFRGATGAQLFHNPRATLAATGAAASVAVLRDQRLAINPAIPLQRLPEIEVWTGSDLAALGGFSLEQRFSTATDYRDFLGGPWIVRPGGVLSVQANTVNVAIVVNAWGFVRNAYPGELGLV